MCGCRVCDLALLFRARLEMGLHLGYLSDPVFFFSLPTTAGSGPGGGPPHWGCTLFCQARF